MIPISDDNPTLRMPVVTIGLLLAIAAAWVLAQGAGFDTRALMASVCNLGMVPGEINIEDSMGRARFLAFYLVCGLAGAAAQVAVDPASPVPVVGASAAISGVMGAYLVLYPRVMVNMLFIFVVIVRIIPLPAWAVLIYWLVLQVLGVLPQLAGPPTEPASGVAFMGHVGGFVAGVALVKLFEDKRLVEARTRTRHRLHPGHP